MIIFVYLNCMWTYTIYAHEYKCMYIYMYMYVKINTKEAMNFIDSKLDNSIGGIGG